MRRETTGAWGSSWKVELPLARLNSLRTMRAEEQEWRWTTANEAIHAARENIGRIVGGGVKWDGNKNRFLCKWNAGYSRYKSEREVSCSRRIALWNFMLANGEDVRDTDNYLFASKRFYHPFVSTSFWRARRVRETIWKLNREADKQNDIGRLWCSGRHIASDRFRITSRLNAAKPCSIGLVKWRKWK